MNETDLKRFQLSNATGKIRAAMCETSELIAMSVEDGYSDETVDMSNAYQHLVEALALLWDYLRPMYQNAEEETAPNAE